MPIDVIRSKIVIAGLSYIQPVFQADYLQIRVIAEVTMPDVLNVDIVTPTDLVTLSTTKALSDTVTGIYDDVARSTGKGLTDSFTMEDSVDIEYWIEKNLADTQAIIDSLTRSVSKALADAAVPTDSATRATTKGLSDVYAGFLDEITSKSTTKGLTDSFSMLDSVDIEYWIEKNLADTQAVIESLTRSVSKALTDAAAPTDLATLATTKQLADVYAGFQDQITSKSVTKGLTDSFTMEDSIDIEYWIEKSLADTQAIADLAAITSNKLFTDSSAISDSLANTTQKRLDDLLNSPIDSISAIDVVKGLSESQAIADSIQTTLVFIRDVADTLVSSDLAALTSIFKKSEILATSDDDTFSVSKGLTEALNLIDNMDGDIEYNIVKLVGELLASTDSPAIAFATQMSDNAVTSSSGVLAMQDYSDITYFLENYVGISRTFT